MSDWELVEAERLDLADLAAKLTSEQWNAPTLCDDWKVRDVVAHVGGVPDQTIGQLVVAVVRCGFNVNKALSQLAVADGCKSPDELVARLRDNAASTKAPPGLKPAGILADVIVHGQDIRRPLGLARQIPEDRLRIALDTMKTQNPVLGNKKRIAGLQLTATDIDWKHGKGPEVRGTGEALLMAICGRKAAFDDLEGDGVATLKAR